MTKYEEKLLNTIESLLGCLVILKDSGIDIRKFDTKILDRLAGIDDFVNQYSSRNQDEYRQIGEMRKEILGISKEREITASENQGELMRDLLKLYEEIRDSGRDYSQMIDKLKYKFHLTRK